VAETREPLEQSSDLDEYRLLCRARLEHVVDVRGPLVLVSQIQRSGGTLLSRLFDGHPELHVHPGEIKIGYPKKQHWPALDLTAPETWFAMLYEKASGLYLSEGYRKSGKGPVPFLFSPRLQHAIFERCVAERPPRGERDILDCYFTSYFNAWLDNGNLYAAPKRAIAGFTPRLAMEPGSLDGFFGAYPDGTLISIVRDPRAWYASARLHRPQHYEDLDVAVPLWRASTEAALGALRRRGERVAVVTFEQLVRQPEATMASLAERIGIAMSPVLLAPTFNGLPVGDSSGVQPGRADAFRDLLDEATIARIDAEAGELYDEVRSVAGAAT
jgi:hypothetical protein